VEKQTERLTKGTVINERYEVLRFVGEGGQKRVYEVKDLNVIIPKRIVLKEMKRSSSQEMEVAQMQLFEQESIILMKLSHHTLPKIYDFFIDQGTFYIIQEYIEGEGLDIIIAKGFLPELKALQLSLQLAEFLNYLHSSRPPIIYRDLKPANVIVGNDDNIYMVDMSGALLPGIGKYAEMVKVKTAGYFPPDSPHGEPGTDTDVYALGMVLYEMLTRYGVSRSNGKLPPIDELRDGIAPETKNILNKTALFGRFFRIHTAWEARIELEGTIKSIRKRESFQAPGRNRFFSHFSILFHDLWTHTMKPLAPLAMLFLTLGLPLVPLVAGFVFEHLPYSSIMNPLILVYFCPLSLIIYLIWVRFMAPLPPLGRLYKFLHKERHLIGGIRIISLMALSDLLFLIALYVNMVINILSLKGKL
jgi:serine/threonine protein kinase